LAVEISLAVRGRDRDRPAFLRDHGPHLLGVPVVPLVVVMLNHRRRDRLALGLGHLGSLLHLRARRSDACAPLSSELSPR